MRLIKWIAKDSLRKKFIVVSLLLLGVPSIVIGTMGYYMSKEQLDNAGKAQLKSSVELVIGMINLLDAEVEKGNLSLDEAQEMVRREVLGEKDNDNKRSINPRYAIGSEGYLFAVNEKAVAVMNPSNEGQDLSEVQTEDGIMLGKEFVEKGTNGGGFVEYKWFVKGTGSVETKISYVEKDPHWGWIVGAGSYAKDFYQGINKLLYYMLIALGVSLVIGAVIVRVFTNNVILPIVKVAAQAERVAQGDLTVEAIPSRKNDEVGKLIHSFGAMIVNLRDLIRQVDESAASVAATSEQLTASAEQNTIAGEQIAASIQEVAVGSNKQVESIEQFSAVASEMAKSVESIKNTAQHVADTSVRASEKSMEGNQAIQTVVKQMDSINQTVEGLSHSVRGLGERSSEIGQIVEVITSISAQTNLLALNAAIEAARAGEHGRGFAVVADEVRKLAEQSARSAQQITQLISAIQEETVNTVQSMESAISEVENGISMVHTAGESFEQIQASVSEVAVEIEEVSSAVKKMAEGVKEVVRNIEVITEVAGVTASSSENVSAATQEQLASMEEISSSAETLTAMMNDLASLIGRFKTS